MQSNAKRTEPKSKTAGWQAHASGEGLPPEQAPRRWPHRLAIALLILLVGGVYLSTLQPGVDRGDAAELQYMSPLLGVCHPPGYVTEVVCGKLFSVLPLGPNVAWRINLMMAISGVIGCLALYGAVRRITRRVVPGLVAATTLGFSGVYWTYSLVAEAYVFYGMFLLLAVYCVARLVESGRLWWLYLAALLLGTCIAGRPSELLIVPGFFGVWLGSRRSLRVSFGRLAAALAIFVLPFAFSVAYILLRENPACLHARDDALRGQILAGDEEERSRSGLARLGDTLYYALGLKWTLGGVPQSATGSTVAARYARHLSGLAALSGRRAPTTARQRELGVGASIGALGIVLAAAGIICYRRQYGWVLMGALFFLGNLLFILWHPQDDAVTFTVPGLAGLAFLAGLGAAGPTTARRRPWSRVGATLGTLAALFLVVANYSIVDRSTPREHARQESYRQLAAAPLPADSVILTEYWSGMTLRYLFHVESGRTDVRIMSVRTANWQRIAEHFDRRGVPTFISPSFSRTLSPEAKRALRQQTPRPIAAVSLLRWLPPGRR